MLDRKLLVLLVFLLVFAGVASMLFLMRDSISKKVYLKTGERLGERLNPEQRDKYGEELSYTLEKFWRFYEKELVTRNDLNDVMEKMNRLSEKEKLGNMEIFDFIGYVSRIYTEAMRNRQYETP